MDSGLGNPAVRRELKQVARGVKPEHTMRAADRLRTFGRPDADADRKPDEGDEYWESLRRHARPSAGEDHDPWHAATTADASSNHAGAPSHAAPTPPKPSPSKPSPSKPTPPEPTRQEMLLEEIRDLLKARA